ncbi:biotin--[acetyl-CoA-carboxylase] ligase [Pricia sp. S334]|uniref:Biotin--[acetyl-CoA-carboxylase] ligase n=1 Tax=Pricia mediterranea TaxID=3076079 RepID=A0ABU3L7I9_9FLAO|nr:biotin--[acetyl-CoA-carboxylase] ligase [Pricia sp. S334]MDT7829657.1 biotin--[acetyl-CoA-carboxylase] ligase [Pricia sp. S334]
MHIIKLDATDSTNAFIRRSLLSKGLADYTVVAARRQERGRGQMGTKWLSEAGKNLTFSVFRKNLDLPVRKGFVLNLCVSLSLYNALKRYSVPKLRIKWPNDILSGTSKICGILIENSLLGSKIHTSIIGIGLNVNQTIFEGLPNVSSLKLLLGETLDLDVLLRDVVDELQSMFSEFEEKGQEQLWDAYENVLFGIGECFTFEDKNGMAFKGLIKGVNKDGQLIIGREDGSLEEFGMKEVKLLYS